MDQMVVALGSDPSHWHDPLEGDVPTKPAAPTEAPEMPTSGPGGRSGRAGRRARAPAKAVQTEAFGPTDPTDRD